MRSRLIAQTSSVLFFTLIAMAGTLPAPPEGIRIEVLSVRNLSPEESARRAPDQLGLDVAVRLRLSRMGERGFLYYANDQSAIPMGYRVKIGKDAVTWLRRGEEQCSPGLVGLQKLGPGHWLEMWRYSCAAVEWEILDNSSRVGEKHAFSVFIKTNTEATPIEVLSDTWEIKGDS